jgi:branched-chain amino acid transport system permease protein
VGGAGNNFGAMLGAALVWGVFEEALRYLPSFGYAGLTESIQFMLLGVLILAFLWWRPAGLVPERRRRFGVPETQPVHAVRSGRPKTEAS